MANGNHILEWNILNLLAEQSVRFFVVNVGYRLNQIQQILVLPVSEEKLILPKVFQDSPLSIGARNEFRNHESTDSSVWRAMGNPIA